MNQFRNSLFINCKFVVYIHLIDGSKYAKVTKDSKNKVTKWNCRQERTCLTPQVTKKGTTGNIAMATPIYGRLHIWSQYLDRPFWYQNLEAWYLYRAIWWIKLFATNSNRRKLSSIFEEEINDFVRLKYEIKLLKKKNKKNSLQNVNLSDIKYLSKCVDIVFIWKNYGYVVQSLVFLWITHCRIMVGQIYPWISKENVLEERMRQSF